MNPSPSAQNPISRSLKKANPSSHFTPSRPSTDKRSIYELNAYFINVGPTLSAQLPNHRNSDPSKYIRGTFSNSFFFSPIHEFQVRDLIVILKENKSTLGSPVKCVKYACDYIYKALTKVFYQFLEQGIVPHIY